MGIGLEDVATLKKQPLQCRSITSQSKYLFSFRHSTGSERRFLRHESVLPGRAGHVQAGAGPGHGRGGRGHGGNGGQAAHGALLDTVGLPGGRDQTRPTAEGVQGGGREVQADCKVAIKTEEWKTAIDTCDT